MSREVSLKNNIISINNFFLLFSLSLLVLGELPRLSIQGFGSIRLIDLTVLITVVSSLFVARKHFYSSAFMKLILGFCLFNTMLLFFNFFRFGVQELVGIVHFFRLIMFFFLYPSIVLFIDRYSKEKILNFLVVISAITAAIGLIQLIVIPDIAFLSQYGWDPHRNRVVSTWLDPNFLSSFLIIPFAIIISSLDSDIKSKDKKLGQLGLLAIVSLASLLTFSRSGLIIFGAFLLLIGARYYQKAIILFFLTLIVGISLYSPARQRFFGIINPDITASARLISWSESLAIGFENSLKPIGYNNYSIYKNNIKIIEQKNSSFGADSSILLIFSTTGIIGLLLFIAPFFYSILMSIRSKKKKYFIFASAIIALVVGSNFNNLLLYPLIIPAYLLILAVINEKN